MRPKPHSNIKAPACAVLVQHLEPGVQEGHAPAASGTSAEGRAQQQHLGQRPRVLHIGSKNYEPCEHRRGQPLATSEQIVLFCERIVNGRLHGSHSTLKLGQVKTAAEAHGEQFVGDIQGSHDGDAFD